MEEEDESGAEQKQYETMDSRFLPAVVTVQQTVPKFLFSFLQGTDPLGVKKTERQAMRDSGSTSGQAFDCLSLLLTAENCWVQSLTVSLKRPPCETGAFFFFSE